MKKFFCFFILFLSFQIIAQGEANIWYFGTNAGLDFTSGNPVALTDGQLNTIEGCATISNSAGQLLFYTDGVTVYNKNQQVMPNGSGLFGHKSSTQSATIIPLPGSSHLFYIFTIDANAKPNGFSYSVVDMNLDGGLGAVTSVKNIKVYAPTCEKIAVVKHKNNLDFWIVIHDFNSDIFYTYLLNVGGFLNTPVISKTGSYVGGDQSKTLGYMKIAPNGSKLAVCHTHLDTVELFDFNNATGIISNPKTILNEQRPYGVEFSPNSEVLYITTNYFGNLYQFNLTASDIASSKILLGSFDITKALGALQLGPDKKIYMAQVSNTKISSIQNPNVVGLGCNLLRDNIDLSGRQSTYGLPAFNQSFFFTPEIEFKNACVGQNVVFAFSSNQTITNAIWNFGDGSPPQNSNTASHIYPFSGTYLVSVTATNDLGITATKTREITISSVPTATQPQDLLVCDDNNDGKYDFDLTSRSNAILNGQDANQFLIKYYASATDYSNNLNITTPDKYRNTTAYLQQTIIAEVYNKNNSTCKATTTFNIDVFDTPKPGINISKLTSCDNTSFGTDTDGRVRWDLTQNATQILNGQSSTQFAISYFTDATLNTPITTPASSYSNTNRTEKIYAKITNVDYPNCFASTSFDLEVYPLPTTAVVTLKQCDDNVDGFSVFNLTEANSKISANYKNETISFYELASEAQSGNNPIPNPTTYTNQVVSNDVVYVRVVNGNGCFRVVQLNLNVATTQIPSNFPQKTFTVCDDAIQGTNTDGISSFNFSGVTAQIQNIFPVGQQLIITYYRNLADALAERNAITDTTNYRNVGYPNSQNIYIRVDSAINNDCLGLGQHITLNVERIPIVQPKEYKHCDDDQDGKYRFDTTTIQSDLLSGLTNVTVKYFDQNNNPLPSPLPNPFNTAAQTIKAVVTNSTTTACSYQTTIKFLVDDLPEAFPIAKSLTTVCDDEINPVNQNGEYAFDTSTFHSTILGTQTGMTVKYYDQNHVLLSTPLPNPFKTKTQNIQVEVINPSNTSCIAQLTIPFVVNPVPKIHLSGNEIVCNQRTITKTLDAGLTDNAPTTDYTYVWKKEGIILTNETAYTLNINQAGLYTVDVTNAFGCSRTRTMDVTASDLATITNVQVSDLAINNSIVISVTGAGDYVYSIDNIDFQESNIFSNIPAGVYTIYVKDRNGCGITTEEVSVLGIPSYFTPNGDGYHDFWNIQGISASINPNTKIYIFDRFSKLIKELSPLSQGWDGTYSGSPLPANDYWYSIQLQDGRLLKGHFSLKR